MSYLLFPVLRAAQIDKNLTFTDGLKHAEGERNKILGSVRAIGDVSMKTGFFAGMDNTLEDLTGASITEKDKKKSIIRQVFIPDLL
jgi:hypothetical protein